MHWYGNYGMGMGLGWFFMILFWGIVIFLVIAFLKKKRDGGDESAEDILKKRYARGELTREDFERMLADIKRESSSNSK